MSRMTLVEAAEIAGISAVRLRKLCQEGRIKGARKVGRDWTISVNLNAKKKITIKPGSRGPKSTIK